jgi:carbohydrate diacid regulator
LRKGRVFGDNAVLFVSFLRVYYDQQMSLTKTAKALYLHKNTIQQRLNTIASKTHLNPRHFEDAVLFYLALRI